jgi:DNA polymerase elongation subunit (family B)
MFKNIYYNTKTGTINLWEQIKGENFSFSIPFIPYVFEDNNEGTIKTIEGNNVIKKHFKNYYEYYGYVKDHQNCKENAVRPEIQFLAERYYQIPDDEIEQPKLKCYSIDIEVHFSIENGFPKPEEARAPVVSISIYDTLNNKTTSFGLKEYKGKYKNEDWFNYIHCKNEDVLLMQFFNFLHKNPPDVMFGWNFIAFDIQYLINRTINIFGEDNTIYKKMSPINDVRFWVSKEGIFNVDVAGITVIDYLEIYKWFAQTKLERYTLDYVSNHELEKGKVDYSEYNDLRELYDKNWDLYIEYNVIDAYRVGQIEQKLKYVKLIQSLSLLSKVPMKYYKTQTILIEGIFLTYFRRNNLCAPTFYGGVQEGYPAAIVKEPQVGLHKWVTDLDITSSYPSAIISLNMSNETYYGRILNFTEDQLMEHMKHKELPDFTLLKDNGKVQISGKKLEIFNKSIEKKLLCISPCGSVFSTSVPGVMATIEKSMFYKRAEVKSKMKKMRKSLNELHENDKITIKEKIEQFNSLQNALKIILNSMYGVSAVPFSRYFNTNIAEAIVSCGRHTIISGEKFVNEILNKPNNTLKEFLNEINISIC